MICVPITASTLEEARLEMREAEQVADIMEWRLDYLLKPEPSLLLEPRKIPIIVTFRKVSEGGRHSIDEAERLSFLEQAIACGAEYIDIEWSCGPKVLDRLKSQARKTKIICSWHDFKSTPSNLTEIYEAIKSLKPDLVKMVTLAQSIQDNQKIFDLIALANKEGQKIIALCMGAEGEISRVLSPLLGGYLTFGSLGMGRESAPGQIEARLLREVYGLPRLKGKDIKLFGLVGKPVNKSQGYRLHNLAFQHCGLNHLYVNFLVEDLASFLRTYSQLYQGLSITMPYKQEIIGHLDELDPAARRIGAVNTVVKKNGHLYGYNTDWLGARKALEAVTSIAGKKAVVLGAGGVSRAIAYGLVEAGAEVIILNRTQSKAEQLAAEFGCQAGSLEEMAHLAADLLINGTSIGMAPQVEDIPIPPACLTSGMIVFDTIYNPARTRLLKEAKLRGCRTISGLEMFLHQAAAQFTLWTESEAPIEIMRSALL